MNNLTVAVATCGRPESLAYCLQALAEQTEAPAEIIVVDQAPSSAVRRVLADSGLASLRYFEQEKRGLSASRNVALANATGEVLAVTDDDCAPDPEWVAALLEGFRSEPAPAACTGPIHPFAGERPQGMYAISLRVSPTSRLFDEREIPWTVGSGGNFAGWVRDLREAGGWDERLGAGSPGKGAEDCDLIDRLLLHGKSIRYESRAIMRHAWQSRDRRKATRSTYAFGIGALCGVRLAAHDAYGWRMIGNYARMHARKFVDAMRQGKWEEAGEHSAALRALLPGCVYGLRAKPSSLAHLAAREVNLGLPSPDPN